MSSIPDTTAAENSLPLGKRSAVREIGRPRLRAFFVVMALVVAAVVVYGFSFTVRANLLEPSYPRPAILYLHVLLFATWVPLFFAQTVLVQAGRVDLHRSLGVWGLVHGSLIPLVGITTAIVMARLHAIHGEVEAVYAFPFP